LEKGAMSESPTCVVEFADGVITRMSTWSPVGKPDVKRGIKLACHVYRGRTGREPPAIKNMHFETGVRFESVSANDLDQKDGARWLQTTRSTGLQLLPLTLEEIERATR
jgi:hypothetical protein